MAQVLMSVIRRPIVWNRDFNISWNEGSDCLNSIRNYTDSVAKSRGGMIQDVQVLDEVPSIPDLVDQ